MHARFFGLFCRVLTRSADQLDASLNWRRAHASTKICNGSDGNVKTPKAIISLGCYACLGPTRKLTNSVRRPSVPYGTTENQICLVIF